MFYSMLKIKRTCDGNIYSEDYILTLIEEIQKTGPTDLLFLDFEIIDIVLTW